jgi:hypothetical protein
VCCGGASYLLLATIMHTGSDSTERGHFETRLRMNGGVVSAPGHMHVDLKEESSIFVSGSTAAAYILVRHDRVADLPRATGEALLRSANETPTRLLSPPRVRALPTPIITLMGFGKVGRPQSPRGECACPICDRPFTGPRSWIQLINHCNHMHGNTDAAALPAGGEIMRCNTCREFVLASTVAQSAHRAKCGHFRPRAESVAAARTGQRGGENTATVATSAATAETAIPDGQPQAESGEAAAMAGLDPFLASRPATKVLLHRPDWAQWRSIVGGILIGYAAASERERHIRQLAMTTVVRQHLSVQPKPTNQASDTEGNRTDPLRGRIESLIGIGALGKAYGLASNGPGKVHTITNDLLAQLDALHPSPSRQPSQETMWREGSPMGISPTTVRNTIVHRLRRGASPAMDGWTRELLVPLAECPRLLAELAALFADIAANKVHPVARQRMNASPLIPFVKDETKIRPIAPESALLKVVGHLILQALGTAVGETLGPEQYGIGGNVEVAAWKVHADFTSLGCTFLADATNAYNCVERPAILRALHGNDALRPAWSFADFLFREDARLVVAEAGVARHTVHMRRGVKQGGVL